MLREDYSRYLGAIALIVLLALTGWMFYEMMTTAPSASMNFAKFIAARLMQQ